MRCGEKWRNEKYERETELKQYMCLYVKKTFDQSVQRTKRNYWFAAFKFYDGIFVNARHPG